MEDARGNGHGVVGSKNPQHLGEQLFACGGGRIARPTPPGSKFAAGSDSVQVVASEHPQYVGEQLLESGGGAASPASPHEEARLWRVLRVSG